MVAGARLNRRGFCAALALGGLLAARQAEAALAETALTVTDMAGRVVSLPAPPRRIILLEARDILSMSVLHADPAALVVGWAATERIDSAVLQARMQRGRRIDTVGQMTADSISREKIAALSPDLVVANLFMAPEGARDPLVQWLEHNGIPVVFSDASSNAPDAGAGSGRDLRAYLRMWGELLGVQAKADDYAAFVDRRLAEVRHRLVGAAPVTTYLEIQSTVDDCCWAAGNRIWGDLLARAGGRTLPAVTAPWFQKLHLEYLISTPHEAYIASGGGWAAGGRPAIAPGLDPDAARKALARLAGRTGFDQMASVRNGRVHAIWTGLIGVPPLNVLFVEVAAKWLHPQRCRDLDPAATLSQINDRFLSQPIDGPLWISLHEKEGTP
ncbi:ABC transporter substrate-binding protein [Ancylobacter sp.]|uniref:ABC transporter substrate-binding protein n=1 Tax=Ancylobacter sp. TaxID=1872567 RepID=UPI003D0DA4D8